MNKATDDLLSQINDKTSELESKINDLDVSINLVEKEAFERGFRAAVQSKAVDIDNKTILIKAPEKDHDHLMHLVMKLIVDHKSRFVIVSEEIELKDLHDVDLKALGLKRETV